MFKITNDMLRIIGKTAQDDIRLAILRKKIQHPKGKQRNGSHGWLHRSGHLANGISFIPEPKNERVSIVITGPAGEYAKILNDGGTIKPKKAKYLTIPLTPEAQVKGARDFSDTFVKFYTGDEGHYGIIFQKKGDDEIPIYKLVKKVEIPAFDFMKLSQEGKDRIISRTKEILGKQFREVKIGN